jgi:hypothetical protein
MLLLEVLFREVLLAFAEAADLLVLGKDLRCGLALGEAVVGLLGSGGALWYSGRMF